ncbi:hypothetical protein FOTG_18617 [Fusarium oxysporum f. sp. vasinfectum 25433]|uniref:EKC/KEOPS complex subunit BUD32 n=1 Tax=Fusarium oxysporum f. sp. vasinfectum 25433 TaxID=1089449 RepID=X0LWR7_FUSOX|nr:hypothetical protein FOTG_18617 [Fusarium oxysporum f. sp. vasinfectum 25433]
MDGSLSVEELTRLLREAEQRAKEERQRAEREQQRAEEAERERQEERQRAEREQQRAEREQQRAEEAERERQEERQRAEEAERERQEERQRAEKEQQRAEASEEQTRLTTLDEYIAACHASVFSRFAIETDPKLTSRGSITNPRDKWCPRNLRPWPHFLDQQKLIFGTLYDSFPTESRVFENRNFLAGLGNRISQRPIADEKTLEYFLHNSVEDPVRAIIQQLKQVEEVSRAFQIGDGVVFENHPHALSDVAEEVVERETPSTPPPQTPDHRRDLKQLRPDQICVYRSDNTESSRRTMVYVSEYKPPHKLTAPHLRLGLRAMDMHREVVNRRTIPTSVDPDARFQYHAEKLTASAITQTYHYMILQELCSRPRTSSCRSQGVASPTLEAAETVSRRRDQAVGGGCKGTVRAFIKDLEHEAAVYERLKPIQGVHVPVFLGAIDLRSMDKTYYYDHRVYVVHMTFLSWGGCSIDKAQKTGDMDRSLEDEAIRSLRAMHREGVVHKDVRLANMLFNPETNRVMVIDFERALLLGPPRRPLAQLVPNKRAWKSERMDVKKVTGDSSKRSRASQSFSEDIWLAKTVFSEWNADRWTRVARAPC